jgi:hypothetical protein
MSEKRLIEFHVLQKSCGHRHHPISQFSCFRADNECRTLHYSCVPERCPIWAGLEAVGSKTEQDATERIEQ